MAELSIDSRIRYVKYVLFYSAGLIATVARKSCTEMSKLLPVSHDTLNHALDIEKNFAQVISTKLRSIIKKESLRSGPGWLIIDDTLVEKLFAKCLSLIGYHKDTSSGSTTKGYCIVVIAWTNNWVTIPLALTYWTPKKVQLEGYKTKIQLSQELIAAYYNPEYCVGVLLDGLYASREMMDFLNAREINYEMRMASNRVITLGNGEKVKIRDLSTLRPQRNARSRTQKLNWNGLDVFITSQIRINRHGERSIVFLVSNYEANSKSHVEAYDRRWKIEMIFRTVKQHLGLEECSSKSRDKQTIHIHYVFLCYAYLECERVAKGYENVESVIKYYQALKSPQQKMLINRLEQFFGAYA